MSDAFLIVLPPTHLSTPYLELFQLLQDHVVWHVVEEPVSGGEDDVAQLDIEGGAVGRVGAEGTDAARIFIQTLGENCYAGYYPPVYTRTCPSTPGTIPALSTLLLCSQTCPQKPCDL